MKKLTRIFISLTILTIMWVTLTELLIWPNFVLGLFLSFAALRLVPVIPEIYHNNGYRPFDIVIWLRLIVWLLGQIFLAGILTIRDVFAGHMNPLLITTPTSLQDDFLISVLAATITLTPGTVTVGRQDNSLIILWLNPTTTDPDEAALKIFRRTELLLSKLQRSM